MKNTNIFIVGVGGQGTLIASRTLGLYALKKGLDAKMSEVHGMAKRGGSVMTHVRFGEKIFSPTVEEGTADVVFAFERLEAARFRHYCDKQNGFILSATTVIEPAPVLNKECEYPANTADIIKGEGYKYMECDADALAKQAGSPQAMNSVMLGKLTALMKFSEEDMLDALMEVVPPHTKEINKKAFELGLKA